MTTWTRSYKKNHRSIATRSVHIPLKNYLSNALWEMISTNNFPLYTLVENLLIGGVTASLEIYSLEVWLLVWRCNFRPMIREKCVLLLISTNLFFGKCVCDQNIYRIGIETLKRGLNSIFIVFQSSSALLFDQYKQLGIHWIH